MVGPRPPICPHPTAQALAVDFPEDWVGRWCPASLEVPRDTFPPSRNSKPAAAGRTSSKGGDEKMTLP